MSDREAHDAPTAADRSGQPTAETAGQGALEVGRAVMSEPGSASSPGDTSLLALVDQLTGLLERSDLAELEIAVGGTGLVLRKPSALGPVAVVPPGAPTAAGPTGSGAPSTPGAQAPVSAGTGSTAATGEPAIAARPSVKAPLTGIVYGAPAPGSAPYVRVGGEVAVGQVIGLIEAMKLFNEIKSDLAGRVVKLVAENGQLVKAKQPLIEVDPL
jgi:acetyl-CoA carboxylase biotin carboxyl carrier protein